MKMNPIDRKPKETPENIFYGVNVNDKEAVQKEYERLQRQHRKVTVVVIIVLAILAVIGFDFVRVNFMESKPLFAKSERVDGGTLFSGLGYKVLYCENGERYLGSVLYKTCEEVDMSTFSSFLLNEFKEYAYSKKILDKNNLSNFVINEVLKDEENEEGGIDYIVDVTYECSDGSTKCFKSGKEFYTTRNNKIYLKLNKYNEVYEMVTFKDTGDYVEKLNEDYTLKVREYLKNNGMLVQDNIRIFEVKLVSNNGKYKFRGNVYVDSYLIEINYWCSDNGNTCVTPFDKKDIDGDFTNLSYNASLFLDEENNVALVGPREYLDIG